MKQSMSRGAIIAFAAISLTTFSAPAFAQDEEVVIVTAPYSVQRERNGEVAVTQRVPMKGLDLRRDSDVNELERRVAWTAQEVCDIAEEYAPRTTYMTSDRECVRRAIRESRTEVREAVNYARGYGRG